VPIQSYTVERWEARIIPKMAGLTKLSAADAAALRSYVLAVLKNTARSDTLLPFGTVSPTADEQAKKMR
jgi:hypothetical protein